MRKAFFILFVPLIVLAAGIGVAGAATLSAEDQAQVTRAENYLNDIHSLRATFLQIAPDGSLSEGTLYLQRPGKIRFEYDPPLRIVIVSNGSWVVYYDYEIDQLNRVPLSRTPLAPLVKDDIDFTRDTTIEGVSAANGILRITLADKDDPDEGRVTLVFEDRPLNLRQWIVEDAQGQETAITMTDMKSGVELDPKLFVFFDPNPYGRDTNTLR